MKRGMEPFLVLNRTISSKSVQYTVLVQKVNKDIIKVVHVTSVG